MTIAAREDADGQHNAEAGSLPAFVRLLNHRRRLPLLFLGVGGVAVTLAVVLPRALPAQDGHDPLTAYALLMTVVVAAAVYALWLGVKRWVIDGADALAAEARVMIHGGDGARVPEERFLDLAPLPEAINDLSDRLAAIRRDIGQAIADSVSSVEEQKSRLAAILRDLHEGVLVCNLMHQVLLYNQTALTLLQVSGGELGLGRNLLQVMLAEPLLHTLDRLTLRVRERRHRMSPDAITAQFVGGTSDGRLLFQGRMSLILHDDGIEGTPTITGYVVTFTDATRELAALGQRDALLREATEGLRPPVANLRVMLETLADHPELDADALASFEQAMKDASEDLSSRLERLSADYRDLIAGSWPMSDLHSRNLINLIGHRIGERAGYRVTQTGLPQMLHGDSYSLVVLFDFLLARLYEATGLAEFDLSAEPAERWVYVDIAWTGAPPVASSAIDGWMEQSLEAALGGLTVGDVLKHHRSDLWSEATREGRGARLRVPLPPAQRAADQARPLAAPAARSEFFDFSLLLQPLATSGLGQTALDELSFVAFDTETTGLSPSSGDELISIAGVRIVKGRLLTGETFSALINPRRKIPAESIPIHGITDAMVQDQPGVEEVLPRFKAFVADSVLVAHNAAFDLKFLKLKEAVTGIRFTNPVLDTMLLSQQLQGKNGDHTLDGIAARLGIQVLDRHTALGDAMVTAAVFLRMIDMLREREVLTLDDAIRSANILVELHARERAF